MIAEHSGSSSTQAGDNGVGCKMCGSPQTLLNSRVHQRLHDPSKVAHLQIQQMSAPPTWTWPDAAHDDLHGAALARPASVLRWGVAAGPHPGPVALTAAAGALLPDGPL